MKSRKSDSVEVIQFKKAIDKSGELLKDIRVLIDAHKRLTYGAKR